MVPGEGKNMSLTKLGKGHRREKTGGNDFLSITRK